MKLRKIINTLAIAAALGTVSSNVVASELETVTTFRGQQVTGITANEDGRLFVNFPKWRDGVQYDVGEVIDANTLNAFPNEQWNSWKIGDDLNDNQFISVQSVVAHNGHLYVLDTANPKFGGVLASPRIFVFNIDDKSLVRKFTFEEGVYKPKSYFNDLRIHQQRGKIYITDSGHAGVVILDIKSGSAKRVLDDSPYTKAEVDHLKINDKVFEIEVHSDGIALDAKNDILYVHALTGYTLYGFSLDALENEESPKHVFTLKTAAPDGMILDEAGNLYFADLENHKIQYVEPSRETIKTLAEGNGISWGDTFTIHECDLYFTNARIHESRGVDISDMDYTVMKTQLASCDKEE